MLRKGSFFLVGLSLLFSCNEISKKEKSGFQEREKYVDEKFSDYSSIYIQANDSITKWILDSLSITSSILSNPICIDSVIVFNRDSNVFFTTINKRKINFKNASSDLILDFGGWKINGKWYFFFMGVSESVVRSYWQDSIYEPLTFEELSYVAYKQRFKTLVKNVNEGHPEKNDLIFKTRIFTELPECKVYPDSLKQHCHDSIILESISGKYKYKLQTEEIEDIKTAMAESKRPDGPQTDERTWWEKLEYGEKVFESKEWKEYLKNKHKNK